MRQCGDYRPFSKLEAPARWFAQRVDKHDSEITTIYYLLRNRNLEFLRPEVLTRGNVVAVRIGFRLPLGYLFFILFTSESVKCFASFLHLYSKLHFVIYQEMFG